MPRVKGGYVTRRRRKRILKLAKGYYGSKHTLYKTAHEQVMKSLAYAYRDRKQRKRDFRKLWITRINAACRLQNISYSRFMHGVKLANIDVNRKMLAELAVHDSDGFNKIVEISKAALANPDNTVVEIKEAKKAPKATKTKVKVKTPKEVKKEEKVEAPKEVKKEVKAEAPKEVKKEEKVEAPKEDKKEVKIEAPKEVKKEAPKKANKAEDLAKLTVAQLRELAKERGVSIPSGSRKADIVDLLSK